jgi:hypothetical protein
VALGMTVPQFICLGLLAFVGFGVLALRHKLAGRGVWW